MSLEQIKTSLFDRLATTPGLPTIHYSNVDSATPTDTFVRPDILPNTTDAVDLYGTNREQGIFQVSIFVPKGRGQLEGARVADAIISNFPRNLQLDGVRIDRLGTAAPSFFEDAWQVTPVSIPYQNIS